MPLPAINEISHEPPPVPTRVGIGITTLLGGIARMANILPDSESRLWLHEFDKCIRESIALRQSELEGLRGLRCLIRRLKIELWAWRRAFREASSHGKR